MPKKKEPAAAVVHADIARQRITQTLELNFMPYAMSVIVSRAIPEIDGFKPSHRKLLYTMYKMGLLTGPRTKSANITGQTMRLNPHGDQAIYETMVRLTRGNESLLTPFIDSKGNFGKVYSRDMAYAASRYTEAKLDTICNEIFREIDHDTVDLIDNYDGTQKEPTLLPTTFPNVLVSQNLGIAVGMASNLCGFNLAEVCAATVAYLKNPDCDLFAHMPAPDFPTGGDILYDRAAMQEIYNTGRGSFRVRCRWRYDPKENIIEVFEIPYTTTLEAVIDATAKLIKDGKIRDISDMRNETGLQGLKLAIDLKRGVDPEKLMQKLYRMTPLQDSFGCNFNILIAGTPRVLGVREILEEWSAWRVECVRRRLYFDLTKLKEKLHLLQGLQKILLDIDKAIKIIRETDEDAEVVPNLMIGFRIDETQAEYVADIRLRNINKQFILKRLEEIASLESEIARIEETLGDRKKVAALIIADLESVRKKYGAPRKTGMITAVEAESSAGSDDAPDYPVHVFLSREGYLKKITPLSLRMSGEQKYKENDGPMQSFEASNKEEILVFTNKCQVYKARLYEFEDAKASVLGDYLPVKLGMDDGESVVSMVLPGSFEKSVLFFFENGKAARVELSGYQTVTNRRRLTGAYSDKSPLASILHLREEQELAVFASDGRTLLFHTAALNPKSSRSTQGVGVMAVKPRQRVVRVCVASESGIANLPRYRLSSLPSPGSLLKPEDRGEEQLML